MKKYSIILIALLCCSFCSRENLIKYSFQEILHTQSVIGTRVYARFTGIDQYYLIQPVFDNLKKNMGSELGKMAYDSLFKLSRSNNLNDEVPNLGFIKMDSLQIESYTHEIKNSFQDSFSDNALTATSILKLSKPIFINKYCIIQINVIALLGGETSYLLLYVCDNEKWGKIACLGSFAS